MHGPADALDYGVKVTGCTLFVVDAGVDTGPIVAQAAVPVLEGDTVESLHERIKTQERSMLVDAVARIAREGFSVDGRVVRFGRVNPKVVERVDTRLSWGHTTGAGGQPPGSDPGPGDIRASNAWVLRTTGVIT